MIIIFMGCKTTSKGYQTRLLGTEIEGLGLETFWEVKETKHMNIIIMGEDIETICQERGTMEMGYTGWNRGIGMGNQI